MLRSKGQKMLAMLAAIAVVSCAIGGAIIVDERDTSESDAVPPLVIGLGLLVSGVFGAGFLTGYVFGSMQNGGDTEQITRNNEAESVANSIMLGLAYYDNALENYDQIWKLTNEHWIRQAELATSIYWSADGEFEPYRILTTSGVYVNSSYMLSNACAQVNEHFNSMSQRLGLWNTTDTYKDKMSIGWAYGNSSMMSKSSFEGILGTAISVTSESNDKAYLSGGKLYVFGGSATIKSSSGKTLNLSEGINDLNTIVGFEKDVYEFQKDRKYCGTIMYVNDPESASIHAGLVLKSGDSTKLATLNGNKVSIDGVSYDNLSVRIAPDDGTTQTKSVMSALSSLETLVTTINDSIVSASDAALTVWNIFTRAGNACTYLTTLTVPNNYNNVNISQAQQEIITVLAMEQLYEYWNTSGEKIKTGDYNLSTKSLQLFCRGDLYDKNGNKSYSNVIFSPFYYGSDLTLKTGMNTSTQTSIVAIWSQGNENLSGWNSTTNINKCELVTMKSGAKVDIFEMMYDQKTVLSVDLDISNIDIIEPKKIDPNPLPEPKKGGINYFQVILYLLGAICIIGGLLLRRTELVLIGIVALAIGLIAGTWLWNLISGRLL